MQTSDNNSRDSDGCCPEKDPGLADHELLSVLHNRDQVVLGGRDSMMPENHSTMLPAQIPNPAFDAIARGLLYAFLEEEEDRRAGSGTGAGPIPSNPLPPVTEIEECCCCVVNLEEDTEKRDADSGPATKRDGAGSVSYTLLLTIKETGAGKPCKCILEWKEWSTTKLRHQGSSEAQRWMDQHKNAVRFFREYDTFKKLPCHEGERVFTLTDTVRADGTGPHHIWIQACAYSCFECECAVKKKCLYMHVVHQDGRTRLEGPSESGDGFSAQPPDAWEEESPGFSEAERNKLRRARLEREREARSRQRGNK